VEAEGEQLFLRLYFQLTQTTSDVLFLNMLVVDLACYIEQLEHYF